jgi:hypothetical protein
MVGPSLTLAPRQLGRVRPLSPARLQGRHPHRSLGCLLPMTIDAARRIARSTYEVTAHHGCSARQRPSRRAGRAGRRLGHDRGPRFGARTKGSQDRRAQRPCMNSRSSHEGDGSRTGTVDHRGTENTEGHVGRSTAAPATRSFGSRIAERRACARDRDSRRLAASLISPAVILSVLRASVVAGASWLPRAWSWQQQVGQASSGHTPEGPVPENG